MGDIKNTRGEVMRRVKKCRASRKNYKAMCKQKDILIKQHEQRINKMRRAIDEYNDDVLELKRGSEFIYKENQKMKKDLIKINEIFLSTYNELQEIDSRRVELVRENKLLHDTLCSYNTPGYKKLLAGFKDYFKSWVKQFDEK